MIDPAFAKRAQDIARSTGAVTEVADKLRPIAAILSSNASAAARVCARIGPILNKLKLPRVLSQREGTQQ